jgi:hypothetical protein
MKNTINPLQIMKNGQQYAVVAALKSPAGGSVPDGFVWGHVPAVWQYGEDFG